MKPIVKWAGGKRQLLPEIKKRLPLKYNKYYEPFIGAGALFFDLSPKSARINDVNSSLINLYNSIKDNQEELVNQLVLLTNEFNKSENKSEFYYKQRSRYNALLGLNNTEEAALFVFLNKSSFNGLYRVNSKGEYNVPFGQKKTINLMHDQISEMSILLNKTNISCSDFETVCKSVKPGDFVYFDPPYYDTFVDYKKDGFTKDDQIRLFNLFTELTKKGAFCMLSNSNTDFIKNLYSDYNVDIIPVKRYINRNSSDRDSTEVIITNYEVQHD